jgi:hypothetical protein
MRISTAAIPCLRDLSHSSGALVRKADWAKPFAHKIADATSIGIAQASPTAATTRMIGFRIEQSDRMRSY